MSQTKVALIGHADPRIPAWIAPTLNDHGIDFVHAQCDSTQALIALAADAHILWSLGSNPAFSAEGWHDLILAALPRLDRCCAIVRAGSGTDNIPVPQATERGILVANTPEATAQPVAEYTVALMLAVARQLLADADRLRRGDWSQPTPPTARSIAGKTIGLIGFGRIARIVAKRLSGFDVRLIAADPAVTAAEMAAHHVTATPLDELIRTASIISLHCPLSPATTHLIGATELAAMQPGTILINTSRGRLIEPQALLEALRARHLGGAGLDVLDTEPPPADHPLLTMDNVIATPHIAAFSEQLFEEMWSHSCDAVMAIVAGRRPTSCVNHLPMWQPPTFQP